jgi:hypothetical protein
MDGEDVCEGVSDCDAVSEGDTDDDAVSEADIDCDAVSEGDTDIETDMEAVSDNDIVGEADGVLVVLGNGMSYTKLYVHAGISSTNTAPSVAPRLYVTYPARGFPQSNSEPPPYAARHSSPIFSYPGFVPMIISFGPLLYDI